MPAVVIGGLALQFGDGGWGVLAGIFLILAALAAMLAHLRHLAGVARHTK